MSILHFIYNKSRNITIKWKLVGVITLALTLILTLFSVGVYLVSKNSLLSSQEQIISSKASTIAQTYVNHLQEGSDSSGQQDPNESSWVRAYLAEGQIAEIRPLNGKQMEQGILNLSQQDLNQIISREPELQKHLTDTTLPALDTYTTLVSSKTYRILLLTMPIYDEKKYVGTVLVGQSLETVDEYLASLFWLLFLGSVGAILLAGGSGYLFARIALRPIRTIIDTVQQIHANRLNQRVPVLPAQDEISLLAATCNDMLDRIENSFFLQNQFVADASHELRTPLAIIEGYANLLDRWGMQDETIRNQAIQVIKKESTRLRNLTNDLLKLNKVETNDGLFGDETDLHLLIEDTIRQIVDLQRNQGAIGPMIQYQPAPESIIGLIREDHLKQVLLILLDNAIQHTPETGQIIISSEVIPVDLSDNEDASVPSFFVKVRDTGEGIPPEDLPHVFNRFYRADKSRSRRQGGAGLGLAIAKTIIESNKGKIELHSTLGVGTEVEMILRRK